MKNKLLSKSVILGLVLASITVSASAATIVNTKVTVPSAAYPNGTVFDDYVFNAAVSTGIVQVNGGNIATIRNSVINDQRLATGNALWVAQGEVILENSHIVNTGTAIGHAGINILNAGVLTLSGNNYIENASSLSDGIKNTGSSQSVVNFYGTTTIDTTVGAGATNPTAQQAIELSGNINVYGTVNMIRTSGINDQPTVAQISGASTVMNIAPTGIINIDTYSDSRGLYLMNGAKVENQGTIKVNMSKENLNSAVRVANTSILNSTGVVDVTATGTGIDAHAVTVHNTAQMNLDGTIKVFAPNINALGNYGGTMKINQAGGGLVQLTGGVRLVNATDTQYTAIKFDNNNSFLTGDAIIINEGDLILDFSNKSIWTGKAEKPTYTGNLDVTLADTARWNMTDDSFTQSIAFNNGGILNMNHTGAGNYEKYRTYTLSGNDGEIMMTTDLQSSYDNRKVQDGNVNVLSDRIEIMDQSSGTHVININDASLMNNIAAEGYLLLIEDRYFKDKDYNNLATFTGGDLRKGGIFRYTPVITDVDPVSTTIDPVEGYDGVTTDVCPPGCGGNLGNNPPCTTPGHLWTKKSWYLVATEKTNEVLPSAKPNIQSSAVRYLTYWRELDTLNQRLGEMRRNDETDGVWVRYKKGNETISNLGLESNKYSMFQVGYDRKFENKAGTDKVYIGLAFHETKGDQVYDEDTNGETTNRAVSLYATWYGEKGHYLDLVGKVGKMDKSFNYKGDNYLYLDESADSSNSFNNISIEYGRKIDQGGWYYEPQAQLTYGHIGANDYVSNQGTYVENDAVKSLVGRTGLMVGKIIKHKGSAGDVYAKAFYNREFKGNNSVFLRDIYGDTYSESHDYSDGWWAVGFGTNWQLGKKNNFYLDLEKTFGGYITTKWQINTGLRLSF